MRIFKSIKILFFHHSDFSAPKSSVTVSLNEWSFGLGLLAVEIMRTCHTLQTEILCSGISEEICQTTRVTFYSSSVHSSYAVDRYDVKCVGLGVRKLGFHLSPVINFLSKLGWVDYSLWTAELSCKLHTRWWPRSPTLKDVLPFNSAHSEYVLQ